MLYLWIALYSAYFFSLQAAAVQIASIPVAYWLILAVHGSWPTTSSRTARATRLA
jgi:hypothetical protein